MIAEAGFCSNGTRLYIREEEIQRPDPDYMVLFHDLASTLLIAWNDIQKDTAPSTLGVWIVPPALIFRPPAYLTAHGSYFLIVGPEYPSDVANGLSLASSDARPISLSAWRPAPRPKSPRTVYFTVSAALSAPVSTAFPASPQRSVDFSIFVRYRASRVGR